MIASEGSGHRSEIIQVLVGHETVEFKKSTSEMKEGMASIAAMLNKHGRGTLYFGVRNDGEVVG